MSIYPSPIFPNALGEFNPIYFPNRDEIKYVRMLNPIQENGITYTKKDGFLRTKLNFTFDDFYNVATIPNLIVNNNVTISSQLYIDNNFVLKGDLSVTGNTLLNGNLDVTGVTTLNNNVFLKGLVGSNSLLFLSSSTKQILTDNNLTYNPSANLLTCTGDANIRENLIVSGSTNLIDANINNNLFVSGASTLRGNLLITGNTEIKNTLTVSGTTNLINTNINNNLFVSGNSTIRGSLLVSGNSDLRGTLNVSNISTLRNTNIIGNLGINQSNALTQLQFSDENVYHIRFDSLSAPAPRYYKLTSMNYGGQIVGSFRIYGTLSGDQSNDRGSSIIDIRYSNRTSASGDSPTLIGSVLGSVGNVANILIYKNTVSLTYDIYLFVNTFCLVDINIQRIGANAPLSYDGSYIITAPTGVTNIYNMQTRFSDTTVNDSILYKSTNKDEFTLNRTYSTAGWYLITSILFVNSFIAGLWMNGWIGGDELSRGNANINLTFKCKNNTQDDPIIYGSCFGQLNNAYNDILIYKNTTTSTYDVYLYQGQFVNNYITFSKFVGSTNNITISSVPNYTTIPPGGLAYRLSDNFSTISNNVFYQGARTGFGIGTATPSAGFHVSNTSILQNGVSMRSTLHIAGASTLLSTLNVGNNAVIVGSTSLNSTLHVAGASTFLSTLNVSGNATINNITTNSLLVTGAVSMGSTLDIDSDNLFDYSLITPNFKYGIVDLPNGSFTSICWSEPLKIWVAVGGNGLLLSANSSICWSYDSITWNKSITVPNNIEWEFVVWANDRFIACGESNATPSNRIIYSYDGLTWVNTNSLTVLNSWRKLCYAPEINTTVCVASAISQGIIYSLTRGVSWSVATGYASSIFFRDVAWSPTLRLFIAVAYSYTSVANSIYRSVDGINWTASFNLATDYQWYCVCWAGYPINKFIVMASTGVGNQRSIYSNDGIIWVQSTSTNTIPNNSWTSVIYNSYLKKIIAISFDGSNRIITSDNGNQWNINSYLTTNVLSNLDFNSDKTVFISSNYNVSTKNVFSSINLIDFTTNDVSGLADSVNTNFVNMAFGNNKLFLVCSALTGSPQRFFTSTNEGKTWTALLNATINPYSWNDIKYSNNIFVALTSNGTTTTQRICTSVDGVSWTFITTLNNNFSSVTYSNSTLDRWVAVSITGTVRAMFSSNPSVLWSSTGVNINTSTTWKQVIWCDGIDRFVAVGDSGTSPATQIAYSDTGVTWIASSNTITNAWCSVAWSPTLNLMVAISTNNNNNRFICSRNGAYWYPCYLNLFNISNDQWSKIIWSSLHKKFFVCNNTYDGLLLYSSDGFNWFYLTIPNNKYNSIVYIDDLNKVFLLGGDNVDTYKKIIYSEDPIENINSACVRINNKTQGVLLPSLTESQKNITNNPIEGMLIYDNSAKNLSFFNGSSFISPLSYIYYASSGTVVTTTVTSGNPYQTDLFIKLTPRSLSSKFYITCNIALGGSYHSAYMLYKNINSGFYSKVGTAKIGNRFVIEGRGYVGNDPNAISNISNTTMDEPKSLLPIVYSVFISGTESPNVLTFNRSKNYTDTSLNEGTICYSTMVIYETI